MPLYGGTSPPRKADRNAPNSREIHMTTILEPGQMTSEELTELEHRIKSRLAGRVRAFQLDIRQEGLVLRGHALTYYAKQLAQHAVMEITKVPIRANEIEVS
jgi:hypothetical protein